MADNRTLADTALDVSEGDSNLSMRRAAWIESLEPLTGRYGMQIFFCTRCYTNFKSERNMK